MSLVLGAVLLAVVALRLPGLPLVLSLMGYFVLFQVMEMAAMGRGRQEAH